MNARLLVVVAGCAAMVVLTIMLWVAAPLTQAALELAYQRAGADTREVPALHGPAYVLSSLATTHLVLYTILAVALAGVMIGGGVKGKISAVVAWGFLGLMLLLDIVVIATIHVMQPRF